MYTNNLYNITSKKQTGLKNGQKYCIDIFPKSKCRWSTGT